VNIAAANRRPEADALNVRSGVEIGRHQHIREADVNGTAIASRPPAKLDTYPTPCDVFDCLAGPGGCSERPDQHRPGK
jgi:hypothetical protein